MFTLRLGARCILSLCETAKVYRCLQQGFQRNFFSQSFQNRGRILYTEFLKPCSTVSIHRNSSGVIQIEESDEPDSLYKQISLKLKGHDDAVLDSYQQFVTMAADELGIKVAGVQTLDRHNKRYTLLKSRHIYKKHRVQYEIRTYSRQIEMKHLTGSTAETFLEYVERNLPEGIAMHVQKVRVNAVPSHLQPPTGETSKDTD